MKAIVEAEGEGVIFRKQRSAYLPGRNSTLYKLKVFYILLMCKILSIIYVSFIFRPVLVLSCIRVLFFQTFTYVFICYCILNFYNAGIQSRSRGPCGEH